MLFRVLVVAGSCLGALLLAPAARADEERVHLRYDASAGCGGEAAFVSDVAARTPKARWVEQGEGVRVFEIAVRLGPPAAKGERTAAIGDLTIRDLAGGIYQRQLRGRSCDEVVDALALVTALAIDPHASIEPTPSPAPPPGPVAPNEPGRALAPGTVGAAPVPSPTPALSSAPPPAQASPKSPGGSSRGLERPGMPAVGTGPPEPSPPVEPLPPSWRWAIGLQVAGASGLGSGLGLELAAWAEVARDGTELLSPSFRLGLSYEPKRTFELSNGQAEIWRLAAHPSGCPIRVAFHPSVGLSPCLGAEVGFLHGVGYVEPTAEADVLWLALTAAARLDWRPWDWALLELQGELGVPLVRQRFYFEPDETIVTADAAYGTIGGSLGARFP
jgi:hypothetical protein